MSEKAKSIFKKALAVNSKPTEQTFPELPDVLIGFRGVLGLAYGIYLGLQGTRSGATLVQAVNLITFVPFLYCRFFLGVEENHFGSQMYFAGTFNALALFLLVWIYLYTSQHEEDEFRLAALLVSSNGDDGAPPPELTGPLIEIFPEESEF